MSIDVVQVGAFLSGSACCGLLTVWRAGRGLTHFIVVMTARRVALSSLTGDNSAEERKHARELVLTLLKVGLDKPRRAP